MEHFLNVSYMVNYPSAKTLNSRISAQAPISKLRYSTWLSFVVLAVLQLFQPPSTIASPQEQVIILHGTCCTSARMVKIECALKKAGFKVRNVDYPSRTASIEKLAEDAIRPAVEECERDGAVKIHFVTHSLGGVMVRSYLARHSLPLLGSVVMLGPPNQGSEVADKLGRCWVYRKIFGPTMLELTTDKNSTANKLGPATFCLGVIAADRSFNWLHSIVIPGRDDGMVPVERTKLTGMTDHIVIHTTHSLMIKDRAAIHQTVYFLQKGGFDRRTKTLR